MARSKPKYRSETDRTEEPKTDGLGHALIDDAEYYVQDARCVVGNCGSWWAPNGAGYVCTIDDAGLYTGKDCSSLRGTDVPWPKEYVLARTTRHVRVDNQSFSLRNYKAGPS